jgi:hypothetical protein
MPDKLEYAHKSLSVLDKASHFYPNEQQLIDSGLAIKEYIFSINVGYLIEKAEKSVFNQDFNRALNYYRDALFYLARDNNRSEEREAIANQIRNEIEILQSSSLPPTKEINS